MTKREIRAGLLAVVGVGLLLGGMRLLAPGGITFASLFPNRVQVGFYYWKAQNEPPRSNYDEPQPTLMDYASAGLDSLSVRRIYVRCFDVGFDPQHRAVPLGIIDHVPALGTGREYIPVVYITVEALQRLDSSEIPLLAHKLVQKVNEVMPLGYPEMQLDHDWTDATRARYFQLLQAVRPLLREGTTLSTTLRLWQYRHPQRAGIPPTDRAMLMVYNTGTPRNPAVPNAILHAPTARQYFDGAAPYPLPLDVALPTFAWARTYRLGRFLGLTRIRTASPETEAPARYFDALPGAQGPNAFRLVRPLGDYYSPYAQEADHSSSLGIGNMKPGDEIRLDIPTRHDIAQVAEWAAAATRHQDRVNVVFFDLQPYTFQLYDAHWLETEAVGRFEE